MALIINKSIKKNIFQILKILFNLSHITRVTLINVYHLIIYNIFQNVGLSKVNRRDIWFNARRLDESICKTTFFLNLLTTFLLRAINY